MLTTWKPGQSYCGTAQEAIDYALDKLSDHPSKILFLEDWRAGDLRDWDEFEFEPHPSAALPK